MAERILFVDDEPKILEAYRRTLRKSFTVVGAEGAQKALEIMAREDPFPVVVSDMQMPEMNGVEFLSEVKKIYPDTVRIMLTGNADQKTAIDAINSSDVFCFINKPCPPERMTEEINKALHYYRTQRVEKELLESTVRGSIFALAEVLSMARPGIFGRITGIKTYAVACAEAMKLDNVWEVEAVALLSQIGLVSLPDSVLEDVMEKKELDLTARAQFDEHPKVAADLINNIPRMEAIAEAIRYQGCSFGGSQRPSGLDIPIAARIVKAVGDMLLASDKRVQPSQAINALSASDDYDPAVLKVLKEVAETLAQGRVNEISITQLQEGNVLAQDIVTNSGALLLEKGQEIGPSMIAKLLNFWDNGEISDRVQIIESTETADVA